MALVTPSPKYMIPQAYLPCAHDFTPKLKLMSSSTSGMVENWSRVDVNTTVTSFHPNENKLVLSNGREYTYKALALAPGFDHSTANIEGLCGLDQLPEAENVFCHLLDSKERVDRNFNSGYNNPAGDMIYYMPKTPCKGEANFWPLIFETWMR